MADRFVPWSPFWDNPVGRYLAMHVGWFAKRWQARMSGALLRRATAELGAAESAVIAAANRYVAVPNEGFRGNLVDAVCQYRNALVHCERLRNGDESANELFDALGVGHAPTYLDYRSTDAVR